MACLKSFGDTENLGDNTTAFYDIMNLEKLKTKIGNDHLQVLNFFKSNKLTD